MGDQAILVLSGIVLACQINMTPRPEKLSLPYQIQYTYAEHLLVPVTGTRCLSRWMEENVPRCSKIYQFTTQKLSFGWVRMGGRAKYREFRTKREVPNSLTTP